MFSVASRLLSTVRILYSHLSGILTITLAISTDPNVGEEAKQHAKHELEKHGVDVE